MIGYEEAIKTVNRELAMVTEGSGIEVAIVDTETTERDFGWVFRYESKKTIETGDVREAISGNGPIIVDRYSGILRRFGSLDSSESAISQYEAEVAAQRLSNYGQGKGIRTT